MAFWDDLLAGGYGALNSALFGLPDWLVDRAGELGVTGAHENLEKWKSENAGAVSTGDLIGTVGSLLIPGGAIAKGVGKGVGLLAKGAEALKLGKTAESIGKGAKALDTIGDIIKGAKKIEPSLKATSPIAKALATGGGSALRGALGALEVAAPRALFSPEAAGELPGAVALGGALGGATSIAGKLLGKMGRGSRFANLGITEPMVKETLVGGIPKSFRNVRRDALREGIKRFDEDIKALKLTKKGKLDEVLENNPLGKTEAEMMATNYNAMSKADRIANLTAGPELAIHATNYGTDEALKVAEEIQGMDWNAAKKHLQKILASPEGGSIGQIARKDAARIIRDNVDEAALKGLPAGTIENLRRYYPTRVLLEKAGEKVAGELGEKFTPNSSTFPSQAISKLLLPGAGGAYGLSQGGLDLADPSTYPQALFAGAVGTLGGGLAAKGLPKLGNIIAGNAERMADKGAGILAKAAGLTAKDDAIEKALPGGAAPGGGAASVVKAEAEVDATAEAAGAPGMAAQIKNAAKTELTDKYAEEIDNNLMVLYQRFNLGQEIGYDDFKDYVRSVTHDFDPSRAETSRLLFFNKADREQYMREYSSILAYKNANIEDALQFEGAGKSFGGTLSSIGAGLGIGDAEGYRRRSAAFEKAVDVIEGMTGKADATAKAFNVRDIEDRLASIIKSPRTLAEKKTEFENWMQEQGIDMARAREWGLL